MRMVSPSPPVSPEWSLRTARRFRKNFVDRNLVDSSLDSSIYAIRMFFSSREGKIIPAYSVGYHYNLTVKWHLLCVGCVGYEWLRKEAEREGWEFS